MNELPKTSNVNDENPDLGIIGGRQSPPLSIFYLILITTIIAIVLAVDEQKLSNVKLVGPSDYFWKTFLHSEQVAFASLAISGMLIALHAWWITKRFLLHPGYLFLVCYGLSQIIRFTGDIYYGWNIDPTKSFPLSGPFADWYAFQMIPPIVCLVLLVIGLFKYDWWWRFIFFLFTVSLAFTVVQQWFVVQAFRGRSPPDLETLQLISQLNDSFFVVTCTFLVAAVLVDLTSRIRRDWIHWFGIVCVTIGYIGIPLSYRVAMYYASQSQLQL